MQEETNEYKMDVAVQGVLATIVPIYKLFIVLVDNSFHNISKTQASSVVYQTNTFSFSSMVTSR